MKTRVTSSDPFVQKILEVSLNLFNNIPLDKKQHTFLMNASNPFIQKVLEVSLNLFNNIPLDKKQHTFLMNVIESWQPRLHQSTAYLRDKSNIPFDEIGYKVAGVLKSTLEDIPNWIVDKLAERHSRIERDTIVVSNFLAILYLEASLYEVAECWDSPFTSKYTIDCNTPNESRFLYGICNYPDLYQSLQDPLINLTNWFWALRSVYKHFWQSEFIWKYAAVVSIREKSICTYWWPFNAEGKECRVQSIINAIACCEHGIAKNIPDFKPTYLTF